VFVFVLCLWEGAEDVDLGMRSWTLQGVRSTSLYDELRAIVLLKLFLERDNI
jgi:hypothetical protein